MTWPAGSPDLSPIENIWADLSRHVYDNGKQLDHIDSLKEALIHEWEQIPGEFFKNLLKSMPKRCAEVIEKTGALAHY